MPFAEAMSKGAMTKKLKVNTIKKSWPRWEDRYDVVTSLGEGAFGKVFHVKNKASNAAAALKQISRWTSSCEIALMQHIGNHPNIVHLVDSLTTINSVCLVLELCGGGDLRRFFPHFEESGMLHRDAEAVQFVMAGLTLALEHLQTKAVIHCDVKPENILLSEMLVPKLGDFGEARRPDDGCEVKGCTKGCTPNYAAPELLASQENKEVPLFCPVDWWSAGVILAELLSGVSPVFDSEIRGFKQHVQLGVPAGLVQGIPADLVHGLCHQESSARFSPKRVQEHGFFDAFDWPGFKDGRLVAPYLNKVEALKRQAVDVSEGLMQESHVAPAEQVQAP